MYKLHELTISHEQIIILLKGFIVISLFFIVITLFSKFIKKYFSNKFMTIVKNTSLRYNSILKINKRYHFNYIKSSYELRKSQNSKSSFDRFNPCSFFEEQIEQNIYFYTDLINKTGENKILYAYYNSEINNTAPFADKEIAKKNRVPYSIYNRFEKSIVETAILHPVISPICVCNNIYISPKGRNSYRNVTTFSFEEIMFYYNTVCDKIDQKNTDEYQKKSQRKNMTPSLRYDIMKRDGFKCTLCGRNVNDGVKLHIDHIIPVSKGGKTIPNNLRTLCDTCNLGKSDKYDEYGSN